MQTALILAMNAAVILILAALTYFLEWSGPGYAAGAGSGAVAMAIYIRLKLGYWV
jgi:hypothetical protein